MMSPFRLHNRFKLTSLTLLAFAWGCLATSPIFGESDEDNEPAESTKEIPPGGIYDIPDSFRGERPPETWREPKNQPVSEASRYQESPLNFGLAVRYSRPILTSYLIDNQVRARQVSDCVSGNVEWLPLKTFGKLGVGVGGGFCRDLNEQVTDTEFASIYAIPITAGVSYHADFFDHQILVPYVTAGVEGDLVKQTSETGATTFTNRVYIGINYAAGLQFLLNVLEPRAGKDLDASTGINRIYLIAERFYSSASQSGSDKPDLSRAEWRFGFRAEF